MASNRALQQPQAHPLDVTTYELYTHPMKSREIIKALEADGWRHRKTRGSHQHFTHPTKPGKVTVPHPENDVPIGTRKSIEKQAGIKLR